MTARSEISNRRREVQASLAGRLANRVFTRKTSGFDGLVRRLILKQAPPIEHDPELDQPQDPDLDSQRKVTPRPAKRDDPERKNGRPRGS